MIPALLHLPVLVLGHGISGQAMARWCVRQGAAVTVADSRDQPEVCAALADALAPLVQAGQAQPQVVCAPFDDELMASQPWGLVCKSPGLSPAQLQAVTDWAQAHAVPVVGELALFAHALRQAYAHANQPPKVLAITGTNGKTTTTALTAQLLARCGLSVAVAGNIGPSLLDVLAQAQVEAAAAEAKAEAHAKAEQVSNEENTGLPIATEQELAIATELPEPVPEPAAAAAAAAAEAEATAGVPASANRPCALPQVWVLELSSFQLDGVALGAHGFEPTAATVLNLSEDHLDWHGSMAHYTAAKFRVFGEQALRVLNREDAAVMAARPLPAPAASRRAPAVADTTAPPPAWVSFGTDVPRRAGDWGLEVVNGMAWLVRAVAVDETRASRRGPQPEPELMLQRLMPAEALRIRGRHNAANALAALALATAAGAPLAPMLHGLREYRGEPHRVESVAVIDGVEFFDDSKGTNVGATLAAIRGLGAERRLVMVMGGDGKGQDFSPLAAAVRAHVQAVVLIGRDAPALRAVLAPTGVPVSDAADLPTAVRMAAALAQSGEAVVMSPACASLDMFRHYAHRAQVFCDTVAELAAEQGTPGVGA